MQKTTKRIYNLDIAIKRINLVNYDFYKQMNGLKKKKKHFPLVKLKRTFEIKR